MGSDVQKFAVPALLLALVTSLQMTYQGIAIARGASTRLLLATLVQLTAGLVLAQIFSTLFGGSGYIYALLIASSLAVGLLASFRHPKPDWKYLGIRSGLKLSLPFIGQGLSTWLLALFDRIAIGILLGATQVGGYQVAYMAGSVLGMILEGLQAAWAPRYHKSSSGNKKGLLVKLLAPSLLIAGCMTVLLVAAAPLLLPVIAPDYEISYMLMWLVALSSLPRSVYFVCVAALLNEGRSTAVMTSTLVSALFTVPAVLFTIPLMGIIGGGMVTLAAFSIQALIVFHRAFRWTIPRTVALVIGPLLVAIPLTGAVLMLAQSGPAMKVIVPLLLIVPVSFLVWKCLKKFGSVLSGWQKKTTAITSDSPVPEA
jgi:O-antigen/teichoic acid export membrane protein